MVSLKLQTAARQVTSKLREDLSALFGFFLMWEIGFMCFVLPFVVSLVVCVRMHNFAYNASKSDKSSIALSYW